MITQTQWDVIEKRHTQLVQTVADPSLDRSKRRTYQRELAHLGTLLEDSTFNVKWRENPGRIYRAQFSVYLGFFGSDSILIKILPNGEVDFEQRF